MTNPLKPALIGDSHRGRFNWLKQLLEQEFGLEVVQANTFDEVKATVAADSSEVGGWSLILIAEDLRLTHTRVATPQIIQTYFTSLSDLDRLSEFVTVLVVTPGKRFSFPLY